MNARTPGTPLCYQSGETVQVGDIVEIGPRKRRAKVRLVGAGRSVNIWYIDSAKEPPEWVPAALLTFVREGA